MNLNQQAKTKASNIINNIKMKNHPKQNHFILTSPEDQLKAISLVDSVQNASNQSPQISNRLAQKFTIDSWDISQKLQPYPSDNSRSKANESVDLSTKINKKKIKFTSVYLKNDFELTNHNFSNKKINTIESPQGQKPSFLFYQQLNSAGSIKKSLSLPKQPPGNQKIIKLKKTQENQMKKQLQIRTKTVSNYLIHQKQLINREKQIIFSQRLEKQAFYFSLYPTAYWQDTKKTSQVKKNKKNNLNYTIKVNNQDQQKIFFSTITSKRNPRSERTMEDHEIFHSTQSQSPIKRFRQFKNKLRQTTNN